MRIQTIALSILLATACGDDAPSKDDEVDARVLDGSVDAATLDASDSAPPQAQDARTEDARTEDAGPRSASDVCTSSGGTVASQMCCGATQSFPDLCQVGPCGCAPANSHAIDVCQCPSGQCFGLDGCQPRPVCSPGADQTCNDNLSVSSLHGHCENNGSCTCGAGFAKNPTSGKCL